MKKTMAKGPLFNYLGRFRKQEFLDQGHNEVPGWIQKLGQILSAGSGPIPDKYKPHMGFKDNAGKPKVTGRHNPNSEKSRQNQGRFK